MASRKTRPTPSTSRPKRALIYTRVSADRAEGRSPAEQEQEARQQCQREGWQVVDVFSDSLGASRHSKGTRRGWVEVQQRLASGEIDVLVTWEASRAQRDLRSYSDLAELCEGSGVLWSYSGRVYDLSNHRDRFETGLDALLAAREADETAHRVRRSMRSNASKGRPHGRRLFGYGRVYDPDSGVLVGQVPEEQEALIVRRMFEEYLAGRGCRTIAGDLNEDGLRTGKGFLWNDIQVKRALTNPAYVARRVYQGEVIGPADWEAIVDEATFDRTQAKVQQRKTQQIRTVSTPRMLSGVARCGKCGGRMYAGHDKGGRKCYQCRSGFHVARDMLKLDEFVSAVIVERLSRPDVAAALASEPAAPTAAEEANARATALRSQLDAAVDQFADGQLTAATLAKIEQRLLPQINEAEAEARRVFVGIDVDVPDNVAEWFAELDPALRREVAHSLLASVTVLPTPPGRRAFNPDAVVIEWRR